LAIINASPNFSTPAQLRERWALRIIALFEGLKGMLGVGASAGLLSLMHHDLRRLASELLDHYHLDPDDHYPSMLLKLVSLITPDDIYWAVGLAWLYAFIRFAMAYGLWFDKLWAEWLVAIAGAVYIPIEIKHLFHNQYWWVSAVVLLCNLAVVAYMVLRLYRRRSRQ
jgi:uncharacterized membrane protein (DUF2068 family)